MPSPRVTRLVKKQAKPKSTRRSVTALPEDLLDTRIVPETTRRKRRRITTADPTATSKRITEPEPHRFVPMEAVMEYLPALSDPAMLSAVQCTVSPLYSHQKSFRAYQSHGYFGLRDFKIGGMHAPRLLTTGESSHKGTSVEKRSFAQARRILFRWTGLVTVST